MTRGAKRAIAAAPYICAASAGRLKAVALAAACATGLFTPASAETLVIVEARGIGSTAGQVVDSNAHIKLRLGEHVRLIGENGNQYCIDGPYDGTARPRGATAARRDLFSRLAAAQQTHTASPLTDCLQ